MSFLDLLDPPKQKSDKATVADKLLALKHLPDDYPLIPYCIFHKDKEIPYSPQGTEVNVTAYKVLSWVRATHDDPNVSMDDVASRLPDPEVDVERTRQIIHELYYFFTSMSHERISEMENRTPEENKPQEEVKQSNPPQSEP